MSCNTALNLISEICDAATTKAELLTFLLGEFSQKKIFNCIINQIGFRSELSDLPDDDNPANKTYESRILEVEPSSEESDEETQENI
ncbi:hypothetical protein TNCV_1085661 [Trichonephila clavipes]|nr:hypothetical protein TNCV_1085661 [Trichonephila clavipes]